MPPHRIRALLNKGLSATCKHTKAQLLDMAKKDSPFERNMKQVTCSSLCTKREAKGKGCCDIKTYVTPKLMASHRS